MNVDYIKDLLYLRKTLDNIIDNGIEDSLRERGSAEKLAESLSYRVGLFIQRYHCGGRKTNE